MFIIKIFLICEQIYDYGFSAQNEIQIVQWLEFLAPTQGVGDSILSQCTFCCGIWQVTQSSLPLFTQQMSGYLAQEDCHGSRKKNNGICTHIAPAFKLEMCPLLLDANKILQLATPALQSLRGCLWGCGAHMGNFVQ